MSKITYKVAGIEKEITDFIPVLNANTNEEYKLVPSLSQADIDDIYVAARKSQKEWADLTISERGTYLLKWAELLLENKEELAEILTNEIAKSYNDSLTEVIRTAEIINYTVEEMYRLDINGASSEQYYGGNKNKLAITKRVPVGVVLAISPFNYPINLAVAKIAPALISGNTVVFKPATQGTVAGIKIIELLNQTGINPSVVNVVTGRGREIGDYLIEDKDYDFISFTGGTNTGEHISSLAKMTPQVMELGGKDAAIILSDANLDHAAVEIVSGAFSYSAQRCTAIKRVLVMKEQKQELTNKIVELVNNLSVGMPMDNPAIVPLVSKSSADYVESLIQDSIKNGLTIETGNKREGNLIYPTVISGVKRNHRIAIEEPFGPVLPIIECASVEEMIEIHNESEFGLQASIFGKDTSSMLVIAPKLEVGTININGKTSRGPDNFPFSGFKKSGMGVQGIKESLLSMTKPQTIVINL